MTTTAHPQTTDRPLTLPEYIEQVATEGERFAELAESGDLALTIDACPGWDARELVRHVGEIHLWAAANLAFPSKEWLNVADLTDLARFWPDLAAGWPDDEQLAEWYRDTNANLVDVLRSTPTDAWAFTFLPAPNAVTMWARRQASEVAIHRCDLELAFGIEPTFDPRVATDLLDELLTGFAPWYRDDSDDRRVVCVCADDVQEQWWVTLGGGPTTSAREGDAADLTVSGSATALYVALWNRNTDEPLRITGDPEILRRWHDMCRVVWSR